MNTRCGVYQISNIVNGKLYIGSSLDMRRRITNHKAELRNNKHGNKHLQRAWNKYGEKAFIFQWLVLCEQDELYRYEQSLIDSLLPDYNISKCAEVSMRGQKYTTEQLVNHQRGESHPWFGKHPTDEERNIMRARMLGKKYGLGYKHTDEALIKMSVAHKGVPFSEEHRRKIGEANSRRVLSEETKAKISASKTGVMLPPRTKEHSAKISAGLRRHYGTKY